MRAPYLDGGGSVLCTGCSACAFACPTGAISMGEDACGFTYPVVDEDRCVNCGKCLKACHMAAPEELKSKDEPRAYGAYARDRAQLMRSASGGVATAVSLRAVEDGGVAYGCVARRESVRHERLATQEEVELSRGSKYVQSDISAAIPQIYEDLNAGVSVAFVGTPCQCAALRRLFGDRDNLLLVDLICEGVPSQRMYEDFLEDLERRIGDHVVDFRFRDKHDGWMIKNAEVIGDRGTSIEHQPYSRFSYYWLFSRALILRDSCYSCPYACLKRVGDLTVGDFWGAESSGLGYGLRELHDGVSSVFVNSSNGLKCISNLRSTLNLSECSFEIVASNNTCLNHPSKCDKDVRDEVLRAYRRSRYEGLATMYRRNFTLRSKAKEFIALHLPVPIRIAVKRTFVNRVKE